MISLLPLLGATENFLNGIYEEAIDNCKKCNLKYREVIMLKV